MALPSAFVASQLSPPSQFWIPTCPTLTWHIHSNSYVFKCLLFINSCWLFECYHMPELWSLQLEVIFCHLNCKGSKYMYTSFPDQLCSRPINIYNALTAENNAKDWEYCEKVNTLKCNVIVLDKSQAACTIKHAMYVTMATLLFHPRRYGDKKHKINLPEVGRHRTSGIVSAIRTFAKS